MRRPNTLLAVVVAIVLLIIADELITRYWTRIPSSGLVSEVIVFAALAYVIAAILSHGRLRFPSLSLPKRRRMRVVKQRDPSQAAADFIKQFEDRAKR